MNIILALNDPPLPTNSNTTNLNGSPLSPAELQIRNNKLKTYKASQLDS